MPNKPILGELRQRLNERYEKARVKVKNPSPEELYSDLLEKKVIGILNELGINYPFDFSHPPPDVMVAARQGTFTLEPNGSTDGGSPAEQTDRKCFTFKSREKGFLVIDHLDFIMEDPIAEGFEIVYTFDGEQVNSIKYQIENANDEGHWKFNRLVLADGGTLQVCVINGNQYASGVFSIESKLWRL